MSILKRGKFTRRFSILGTLLLVTVACTGDPGTGDADAAPDEATPSQDADDGADDEATDSAGEDSLAGESFKLVFSSDLNLNDVVGYRAIECADTQYGLTVEPLYLDGGITVQTVLSGQADVGEVSLGQMASAVAEGADLKAFGATDFGNGYSLLAPISIEDPAGVAGGTHGMGALSGIDRVNADSIYEAFGVLDEVELVLIGGSSDRAAALQSGRIEATMLHAYQTAALEATGEYHSIGRAADYSPPIAGDIVFASSTWLEENQEAAQAFVDCIAQATAELYDDPQAAADYIVETVPDLEPELVGSTLAALIEAEFWAPDAAIDLDAVQTTLDEEGISLSPDDVVDSSFTE